MRQSLTYLSNLIESLSIFINDKGFLNNSKWGGGGGLKWKVKKKFKTKFLIKEKKVLGKGFFFLIIF